MKYMEVTRPLVLMVFLVGVAFAKAQPRSDDTGIWNQYFATTDIGAGLQFLGDAQYRTHLLFDDFQQLILRGSVGLEPKNTSIKIYAGYGFFFTGTQGPSTETTTEHRLHQDLWFDTGLGGHLALNHRLRVEERFIKDQDFRTRLRYLLDFKISINHRSYEAANTLFIVAWNEIFINGEQDTGAGNVSYFDRNWMHLGLGFTFDAMRLQAGYMRETTDAQIKDQYVLALFHNF